MSVGPGIDQLSIYADAIAGAADGSFQNVCHTKGNTDFAQVSVPAAVLSDGSSARDFQVCDLGQIRKNIVLNSISEVCVLLVIAEILKRQYGNALFRNV